MATILYVSDERYGQEVKLVLERQHTVEHMDNITQARDVIERGRHDLILIADTWSRPGAGARLAEDLIRQGCNVLLLADEESQAEGVVCLDAQSARLEPDYLMRYVGYALKDKAH